jgi:hypothetical protein
MAMTNPHPWVMPSIVPVNGYDTGAGSTDDGSQGLGAMPTVRKKKPQPPGVAPAPSPAMNAGREARLAGSNIRDAGITGINTALSTGANKLNQLTMPIRAGIGDVMDFARGFEGAPARPNEGQPVGTIIPPQLAYPTAATATGAAGSAGTAATPGNAAAAAGLGSPPTVSPKAARDAIMSGAITNIDSNRAIVSPSQMTARLQASGGVPSTAASGGASASNIDSGVTLPDGRKLGYGAMVNGVPTFSDGSGASAGSLGAIPRTMTQADINGLGARLPTVPAGTAPAGFPSPVAFNSDNTDANVAAIMRSQQGGKFGITPEMNASADLAAIMNRDPRSSLGRAALNLSRDASGASTVLQRKAALGALGGLDDTAQRNYLATTQGSNSLADINAQGGNALARTKLGGLYDIAGIRARNQGDLARTDLAGQYGVATALARPNGAVFAQQKELNTNAIKLLPQILGLDPAGQITDPVTKKQRPPTHAEIARGIQIAKQTLDPALASAGGGAPAAAAATATPTLQQFLEAARSNNPGVSDADLTAYYNNKYGASRG